MNLKLTLKYGILLLFLLGIIVADYTVGNNDNDRFEKRPNVSTRRSKYSFAMDCRSPNGIYELGRNEILTATVKLLTYWGADNIVLVHDDRRSSQDLSNIVRAFEMNMLKLRYSTVTFKADHVIKSSLMRELVAARFIVLMCDDQESSEIFSSRNHSSMSAISSTMHTWLIISSNFPRYFAKKFFREYAKSENIQVVLLMPTPSHIHCGAVLDVEMFDVFFSEHTHNVAHFRFATFSMPDRLRPITRTDVVHADHRLLGRITRLFTFRLSPYIMINEKTKAMYGYLPELYQTVGKFLNIRYITTISDDPTYGIEINGSFSGFIGKLQRSEHDLALAAAVITQPRKRVVYFSVSIIRSYMTLFMRSPGSKVPPTIYFLPFSPQVWLCLLLGCVTYLAVLWVVAIVKVLPTIDAYRRFRNKVQKMFHVLWQSVKHIGELLSNPSGLSAKILVGIFFWAGMMIFTYYSSVFTSFLTYRETKLPITTLEELASNRAYEILIVNQTMHYEFFKRAKDGVQAQIWNRMVAQGSSAVATGFNEGYYKMLSGKYVYLSDGPATNYLSKDDCQVGHASAKYFRYFYHMTYRKDFPYNDLFSSCILRLMEGGVLSRLQRLHLHSNQDACYEESTTHSIELAQSATIFVILLSFVGISLFALLIEIAVYKHQRKRIPFQRVRVSSPRMIQSDDED